MVPLRLLVVPKWVKWRSAPSVQRGMSTVRLLIHVLFAGVYVFLTSLTLLVQLASSDLTITGLALLTLLGAWAGASSTLRTRESLYGSAAGIGLLLLLAVRGGTFNVFVNLWILFFMVPLAATVWLVVAWRRWADEPEAGQTLRATH